MTKGISDRTWAKFNPTGDPNVPYPYAPPLDAKTRARVAGLPLDEAIEAAYSAGFDDGFEIATTPTEGQR
jgi:hypothetical protein